MSCGQAEQPLGDGRVTGADLFALAGCAGPVGDGPATAGQDSPEEQQSEPGCGPLVERGGEAGEPLARRGPPVQRCYGRLRPR